MRLIAVSTIFLATIPVFAFSIMPKTNTRMLAIFDAQTDADPLLTRSEELKLNVISYDAEIGHLIVQDRDGRSAGALYSLGAKLVIDADLMSCSPANVVKS